MKKEIKKYREGILKCRKEAMENRTAISNQYDRNYADEMDAEADFYEEKLLGLKIIKKISTISQIISFIIFLIIIGDVV